MRNNTIAELRDIIIKATEELARRTFVPLPPSVAALTVKNNSRKNTIELAKKEINYLINNRTWINKSMISYTPSTDEVHFIVNKEKRTVVALIKFNNQVYSKGTAKCNPGDTFNSYIGKAVALYRALDLKLPEYLLNIPEPTTYEVGDIIQSITKSPPATYEITSVDPSVEGNLKIIKAPNSKHQEGSVAFGGNFKWAKILDDSKE